VTCSQHYVAKYGVDSCGLSSCTVSNLTGVDTIMEVKVRATLKSLSVDLTADSGPLLKVVVSGILQL